MGIYGWEVGRLAVVVVVVGGLHWLGREHGQSPVAVVSLAAPFKLSSSGGVNNQA